MIENPHAIVADHLGKTFTHGNRTVVAVRDISLCVSAGELFGLFGHNGAGKSTLVRILATLVRPTHGSAHVNGFELVRDEQKVRASIGLVTSDERSFYGRLNALDNLHFYAALQNVPRQRIAERVQDVLALFNLSNIAKRPFQTYSTGQKQRLNMARAMLHDPPILFLDEPTKSMDVQTSDFVKALVKNELVGRQHKTVVFISHELYEMENFCDRVGIVHRGELRALGTPAELLRQLPMQPSYQLEVEGDVDAILRAVSQLGDIASVNVVQRDDARARIEIDLNDGAGEWQTRLWHAITSTDGQLRAYHQIGSRSLRDVIRHFTSDDEQPQTTKD